MNSSDKANMADIIKESKLILTKIAKDDKFDDYQKKVLASYAQLLMGVIDMHTSNDNDNDAQKNIDVSLKFLKKTYNISQTSPKKVDGGRSYVSGGRIFVFEDRVKNMLETQKISLKLNSDKKIGVTTKLHGFYGTYKEVLQQSFNLYVKNLISLLFKDIFQKGIKMKIVNMLEQDNDITHAELKKMSWKRLMQYVAKSSTVLKSDISTIDLNLLDVPTLQSSSEARKKFFNAKRSTTPKQFYQRLYETNVLLSSYLQTVLETLVENVNKLEKY